MDTEIRYLEVLGADLAEAARRETPRRRVPARSSTPRKRPTRELAIAAAISLLVAGAIGWLVTSDGLSGFSSDDSGGPSEIAGSTGGAAETGATGATGAPAPMPTQPPGGVAGDDGGGATFEGPRIIRTAELGLVIPVDSFDDRFAEAADLASANGGFVADSTTRDRSGNLTIRVPAEGFDETLGGLRDLGDVRVETIQGRDVTADYIDLQARLTIAKSRRDVLLRLMDEARSIGQTIRVQNALDDTQLRIEELEGQLRLLDDRVALATIQVSLREVGVEPVEEVDTPSIPNAFERAAAGFVGVIAAIVVGLGYLLPLGIIGLVAWLVVTWVRRRRAA